VAAGCSAPATPWHKWDHAGLLQAEAQRGIAVAQGLSRWQAGFGDDRTPEAAFAQLARALGTHAQGSSVHLSSAAPLTALLDGAPGQLPQAGDTAWLAWLLWWNAPVQVLPEAGGWTLQAPAAGVAEAPLPADWLERMIEQLAER
jgi:two-component system probable response regulator PhcQ